ncbi:hypothetical protein MAPG_04490 [Magnaporthiopsis poae ATCC 64411]|uniref:Amine oxidase n=1 Tax=Magnaporthiopsis poae (strain ATCC 64411 / 73-15) TaxID=644358 RepID=A0A0C4DWV7_MAGP6|nr:hypothetical protein MAPG_04490 [Magnaporthiopsis poae ATCC 64411]
MVRLATLMATVTLLASTASLAYGSVAQDVSGFTYVTSGPAREGNIRDYWYPTSQTALSKLKSLLGPDRLKELLAPEIAKGDAFWRDIVARSTGASWKAAEGRTLAFLPNVTANDFRRWFMGCYYGTVFGVLHIAVRDVAPAEYPEHGGARGIEVYAAVWYGDASEDAHLETEREHMIIEEINLSLQCQKDIVSGRLPPAA